jgi:hypothetical protein
MGPLDVIGGSGAGVLDVDLRKAAALGALEIPPCPLPRLRRRAELARLGRAVPRQHRRRQRPAAGKGRAKGCEGRRALIPARSMTAPTVTLADIEAAAVRLAGQAVRTPLFASPHLDAVTGARVFLKPECLQRTGSFKFRGGYNAVASLPPDVRAKGVVAVSSGNHAQGVAEAARLFGVPASIIMPADAPPAKLFRTRRSGADVITYDRATEDRDAVGRRCWRAAAARSSTLMTMPGSSPGRGPPASRSPQTSPPSASFPISSRCRAAAGASAPASASRSGRGSRIAPWRSSSRRALTTTRGRSQRAIPCPTSGSPARSATRSWRSRRGGSASPSTPPPIPAPLPSATPRRSPRSPSLSRS